MFDHLTDKQRAGIHTNNCVRGSELAEARALCDAAEPGQWLVGGDGEKLRLVRYASNGSRPELSSLASFALAAASVTLIPRLLRGIDALEQGVATAQGEAASFRRSYAAEQDAHKATIERQSKGATGPEHELDLLAQYVTLSAAGDAAKHEHLGHYVCFLLTRWAGGASIAGELRPDVMERVKRQVEEREKHRAEAEAEIASLRVQLRDALGKVARGEVPEALQPALKEAKKRARK